MQIKKAAEAACGGVATDGQMEAILAQCKGKLTKEDVYVFSVRLCDDRVDRDGERFDTAALPALAKLFIGKTGIIDHRWSSDNQVARIFQTQVVRENGISYIKAWAYIRRGGSNEEIIADIEAGIKKEVSIGCSMGRSVCSVCGSDYGSCGHEKGQMYDGQICCAILQEPMDAYEFSFVAVPAQREAGVMKGMARGQLRLKDLAEQFDVQAEYRALYKLAQLGREYEKQLHDDVVRLCLSLELGAEEPVLRAVVEKAATDDLQKMKAALEARLWQLQPVVSQLTGIADGKGCVESGFLI